MKKKQLRPKIIKNNTTSFYLDFIAIILFSIFSYPIALYSESLKKNDKALDFSLPKINTTAFLQNKKSFVKAMVSLKDYCGKGAKHSSTLILLDFFATWCIPCLSEIPELIKLYDTYKDKGFMIVSIAINIKDEKTVEDIIRKNKINYPVLSDKFDVIAKKYEITKLPHLLLINEECDIIDTMVGEAPGEFLKLKERIKELIK